MNSAKITDKFLSNTGLVSNIFGKYSDKIVHNTQKEKAKLVLYHVFGYKDIFEVLPAEVDEDKTLNLIKVLNQYYDQSEPSTENGKGNRL